MLSLTSTFNYSEFFHGPDDWWYALISPWNCVLVWNSRFYCSNDFIVSDHLQWYSKQFEKNSLFRNIESSADANRCENYKCSQALIGLGHIYHVAVVQMFDWNRFTQVSTMSGNDFRHFIDLSIGFWIRIDAVEWKHSLKVPFSSIQLRSILFHTHSFKVTVKVCC